MRIQIYFIITLMCVVGCTNSVKKSSKIAWQHEFSKKIFEQAKKDQKFVLLTLEANWCHWCHVMEDSTYSNPEVIDFLNKNFISVAVDQDANPELASRYRKYGWPATIILDEEGNELLKKAGFMNPKNYLSELKHAISTNTQEDKKETVKLNSIENFQKRLEDKFDSFLSFESGAFQSAMKYLDEESVNYARFDTPNKIHRLWLKKSISGAVQLSDPEWGGIYQYSTQGDWLHPHYEKLLHIQARYMRLFLDDYAYTKNKKSLQAVREIQNYCNRFLQHQNGLFSNAQDADLKKGKKASDYFTLKNEKRIKLGIPAIDTNAYTHSNADYARSLLKLAVIDGTQSDLDQYSMILKNLMLRKNNNSLFNHAFSERKTNALRDNLAMANLFIEHLKVFPEDKFVDDNLNQLMNAIVKNFQMKNGAFKGFSGDLGLKDEAVIEENITLGRLLNWYSAWSGKTSFKKYTKDIINHLQNRDAQEKFYHEPGIVMLLKEYASEGQNHVSVNESKNVPLLKEAYIYAPFYSYFKILRRGKGMVYESMFGDIKGANLFICTPSFCNSPMQKKEDIAQFYKEKFVVN